MTYKPDLVDRIADATSKMRSKNSWEYDNPTCAWENMPWWVRWPLAALAVLYFGGAMLIPLAMLLH